ncbi:MAG TPA: hypothetical protein VK453_17390 [Micromonosporaceae bacterium]|nr:hypothetical protein [Micromonosporaceae bacterium]
MTTVEAIRAEALFVSWLQASERPAPEQVRAVVATTLRGRGVRGCAAAVAEEFGDHPDRAVARMGWALMAVSRAYPPPASSPARRPETAT